MTNRSEHPLFPRSEAKPSGEVHKDESEMAIPERNLDTLLEAAARRIARTTSRRGFLARVGTAIFGVAAVPLLPVSRASAQSSREVAPDDSKLSGVAADPTSCEYWRYCSIDGFLAACCGGTYTSCPPGTEMSRVTWIGTCRHPADGRDYVISYNDCCGQTLCLRCRCTRTEGEKPVYYTSKNNDLLWCFGTKSRAVHCSVAVVLGVATKS